MFEIFGPAVGAIGGEGENAVIAPVAPPGEVGDRHQLHSGDPQIRKIVEPCLNARESTRCCKGSDMQFVNYGFFPPAAFPRIILPIEAIGIDDFAEPMYVVWLKAGGWIWNLLRAVDPEMVLNTRPRRVGDEFKPTGLTFAQRKMQRSGRSGKANFNLTCRGGPQAKAHAPIFTALGAEGHFMTALHSPLPSFRYHCPCRCRSRQALPSAPPWTGPAKDRPCRRRKCRKCASHPLERCPSMRSSGHRAGMPSE